MTEKIKTPIEVLSPTGDSFVINEGLPYEHEQVFTDNFRTFGVPDKPYVFKADRLIFGEPLLFDGSIKEKDEIEERKDQVVLFMHGEHIDGKWAPKDPELLSKGVTIQNILDEYEKAKNIHVDFAFVCAEEKVRGRIEEHNGKITVVVKD